MARDLPVVPSSRSSKGDAQENSIIVEVEEPLNSRLGESHSRRSTYDLPPGSRIFAFYTDADPKQQTDQPVEKPHCTEGVV